MTEKTLWWCCVVIVAIFGIVEAVHQNPQSPFSVGKYPSKVSKEPIDLAITLKIKYPDFVKIGDTYHRLNLKIDDGKFPSKVSKEPIDFAITLKINYPDFVKIGDTYHSLNLKVDGIKPTT